MFKNLILAILIAIVLSYCLGYMAMDWFDVRVQIDQHWVEPVMSLFIVTLVMVVLVIVGFVVALSVAGAVVFGLFAAIFALLIAGVSAFWPFLLAALVIYYLVKDKHSQPTSNRY